MLNEKRVRPRRFRDRQKEATRKGTTYKPTESEKSLMSRTGGLGAPRGQAFWPVRGPTLHRYGEQLQGELRWKGMVIGASEGTEVKAIADGRVILADWLQGYGLVVVVEHGKGDMSLYGYNQSALVSVGSQVRAGQPIALVGSSGGQGRPSLYFEIRRQGQAVNPTAVVGKISFCFHFVVTFLHLPLCWRSPPPYLLANLPSSLMILGYRPHNENQVLAMPSAISVAVLPDSPHAREMATKAHNSGHEVLIHLPMAPLSKQPLEKNTLRPGDEQRRN